MNKQRMFVPDFLIIPYQLISDEHITPLDEKVYALVYWYEHMKDGICTVANQTIADMLHVDFKSVQRSLNELEERGYLVREYKDTSKKHRKSIHTTVSFHSMSGRVEVNKKEESEETPADFATRFFAGEDTAVNEITAWLKGAAPNLTEVFIKKELQKFILYWTEPTPSGKKVRWQTNKTFEVKRRLMTWFGNIKSRAQQKQAGITV